MIIIHSNYSINTWFTNRKMCCHQNFYQNVTNMCCRFPLTKKINISR